MQRVRNHRVEAHTCLGFISLGCSHVTKIFCPWKLAQYGPESVWKVLDARTQYLRGHPGGQAFRSLFGSQTLTSSSLESVQISLGCSHSESKGEFGRLGFLQCSWTLDVCIQFSSECPNLSETHSFSSPKNIQICLKCSHIVSLHASKTIR